ncbi:MAG: protein-export chaperone SecB [Caulobacter sp.]|nr:protein-export chaperone SecB [Caulobacter sp.]
MTDEKEQPQGGPGFAIAGQYVKDLSFEVPNAPKIFADLARGQPDIPINIDIRAERVQDKLYEVVIHLRIDSSIEGKQVFIVELVYAGLFQIDVPNEHLQPMLLIECPRMLFPFARNIIADVTREGGFPPLMLQPVDFVTLYRQRMAEKANEAAADETTGTA